MAFNPAIGPVIDRGTRHRPILRAVVLLAGMLAIG